MNRTPRLLTKQEAASYCGYSERRFSELVGAGRLPLPIPNSHRWDIVALDRALDRLSGIVTNESLSPFERWKAGHGQNVG